MADRLDRNEEAAGSIPVSSTIVSITCPKLKSYPILPRYSESCEQEAARGKLLKTAARVIVCLFCALVIVEDWVQMLLARYRPAIFYLLELAAITALTALFYWSAIEKRVQFALSLFRALVILLPRSEWFLEVPIGVRALRE